MADSERGQPGTAALAGTRTPDAPVNGDKAATRPHGGDDATTKSTSKKRKHKSSRRTSGAGGGYVKPKRRHSMSKAARDPRDEPESSAKTTRTPSPDKSVVQTRSPSPFIDFDGLSRPSTGTRARLEEGEEEKAQRMEKMRGAVRTILECVGEDPDRAGLLGTPDRYAKALLDFTQGYQQNVRNVVNGAIFHEGHNEMVIVKDIEVFSLCEHHMVPFTGKVGLDN